MTAKSPDISAPAPPRGKKRSSSIFSSGDENKKARGRPRVEPQDQTAADRRRTQIRLAQRSYRQRKEGTITELQSKVSRLEFLVSEMSDSFQDINRNVLSSNLGNANVNLARQITDAANRFKDISQTINHQKTGGQGSSDDSLSDPPGHPSSPTSKPMEQTTLITSKKSTSNDSKRAPPTIVSTSERGVPSVWGYETIIDSPPDPSETSISPENAVQEETPVTIDSSYISSQPTQLNTIWQPLGPLTPYDNTFFNYSFGAASEMPSPMSYAALEESFERRLHRTVLEAGVRLLTMRHPPAAKMRRVFGHVMKYYSQLELRDFFIECLNRGPGEPLESRAVYPYAGPYTQQYWYIEPQDTKCRNELLGAPDNKDDGTWFVPSDVQRYLEAKNVQIPRGALFVDWEYESIAPVHPQYPPWPSPAASINGDNITATYNDPSGPTTFPQFGSTTSGTTFEMQANNVLWVQNGVPSPPNSDQSMPPPPMHTEGAIAKPKPPVHTQRVPHKFTIDVEQLVADLQFSTMCLGKCPGFRRRDIELAFESCLIPVFG